MNSCTHCANELVADEKFCSNCGKPVPLVAGNITCPTCSYENSSNVSFCEKCGSNLKGESSKSEQVKKEHVNKITSSGSYSGTMVSSGSKFWKRLRITILIIALVIAIALIVWFQLDPEAGKKLTDVLMGTAFMMVFFFFGWLFFRGKKGRKSSGWDEQFDHDDNDYDDD